MMQRAALFLLIVLTATFTLADDGTPSSKTKPRMIVIGTELDYPPYSFRGENGIPSGYNVDLAQAVAETVGLNVHPRIGPWNQIRNALETGDIDAICGMYYSLEREKRVEFTSPFAIVYHAIFARKGAPNVTSEQDLKGKKLIVMRGDIMHDYVVDHGLCDDPILAVTISDILRRLAKGEGDYALTAELPGVYWIKQLDIKNLAVVGPPLAPSKYCFAVRKGDTELLARLNEGLAIVTKTGRHKQLYEKWFKTLEEGCPHGHYVLKQVPIIVLPLFGLLVVSVAWLWTVRRKVRHATAKLRNEMADRRRAEEEASRLARFPAENPNPVLRVDSEGRILYANQAAEALLDVWGCRIGERVSECCFDWVKHAMSTGQHERGECEAGKQTFAMSIAPMPEGGYANLYGMDITDRKRAEGELRESEVRYRTLVEQAGDAVILHDHTGRILDVNRKACENLGYTREELLTMSIRDIDPEGIQSGKSNVWGKVFAGEQFRFESRHKRKDGSFFPVEFTLGSVNLPVGRAVLGIVRDITERKQAEEAIHQQRDFFRIVIDTVPAFVCVKKLDGKYALANKALCDAYGTTVEGLEGHTDAEFSPLPDEVEGFLEDDRRVIQDQTTVYIPQEKITYTDGSVHWLSTVKTPLIEKDGSCDRLLAVAMDISKRVQTMEELKKLNEELEQRVAQRTMELESRVNEVEQLNTAMVNLSDDLRKTNRSLERTATGLETANQELEAFSYSVSHDLRAPLRAMDGFSQAILEDYGQRLDETGRDYLERIRAAAQHMGNLIDAILELSRAGRSEMASREVNLSILAEKVIDELQQAEPDRHVKIVIASDLTCRGDANLLRQVLANLLGNAWKFTAPRSEARIELTTLSEEQAAAAGRTGQTVYVVRDNGVGFDMHYATKLFGAFQRLHNREEFPGTGVGLATVQRIVRRHGGDVWAESVVDQGASIFFTLRKHESG